MSKKKDDSGGQLVGALATMGAVYLARKVITIVWTRATGKVPPTDPADPAVSLAEALGWAVIAGITVEAARLFAVRATVRRASRNAADAASK